MFGLWKARSSTGRIEVPKTNKTLDMSKFQWSHVDYSIQLLTDDSRGQSGRF